MSSLVVADRVRIAPGSATRDVAIREAVGLLVNTGVVTDDYVEAVLQRELSISTYMGNGVAIPHAVHAAAGLVTSSAIALVRYDGGVDWGGDPVRFVVAIAGRGFDHLPVLAAVASVFSDSAALARLADAPSEGALFAQVRDAFS